MPAIGYGTSTTSISAAGTTEICPGPSTGLTRAVNGVFVFNDDSIRHEVLVHYQDPSLNIIKIAYAFLGPNESLRVEEPPFIPMAEGGQLNLVLNENIGTTPLSTSVIYTDLA